MNSNPAYNFQPITVPLPNQPGWANLQSTATQQVLDDQYRQDLDRYFGRMQGYLDTESLNRGSNRSYTPTAYPLAIPVRKLVVYDKDGTLGVRDADPDPNIHPPVLADLPPEKPVEETFGGPHDPSQALAQMMGAIMAMLVSIKTKVGA